MCFLACLRGDFGVRSSLSRPRGNTCSRHRQQGTRLVSEVVRTYLRMSEHHEDSLFGNFGMILVGGFNPFAKILVKLDHFPK